MVKVALISLGCAKNLVDSEGILARLAEDGDFEFTHDPDGADGVIINTCGFLQSARRESEAITAEMIRLKSAGRLGWVAMAGCLVERYGPDLKQAFPEVSFLGFKDYETVEAVVRRAQAGELNAPPPLMKRGPREHQGIHGSRMLLTQQSFAYLRISEGCNLGCTFCVIPDIRGNYRSRSLEDVTSEAEALALGGVNELILISQDSTYYGRDTGEARLPDLVAQLAGLEGIEWIRLQYLNPAFTEVELLETMARTPQVVPYLDMPIQHAADSVLLRMGRTSTADSIRKVIDQARGMVPDITLRTTVMVGFPGETEAEFQELLDFIEAVKFDRLGCFQFSSEPGTPAARLPDPIPEELMEERFDRIMALQETLTLASQENKVGTIQPVMVDLVPSDDETPGEGRTTGDSPEVDCSVILEGTGWIQGGPVPVRILARQEYDLIGNLAEKS